MLSPSVEGAWQYYLDSERTHLRSKVRLALDQFIAGVLALPEEERKSWALRTAWLVADEGQDIPIRLPLFRSVLLPALIEGVIERRPGCARWLAHFEELSCKCGQARAQLPEYLQTSWGLLKEALLLDSNDDNARKRLVRLESSYLAYCLHELPSGILYGADGATIPQCEELSDILADFIEQVELAGLHDDYQDLIAECAFHFPHYRDYLSAGCPGGSYEKHVSQLEGTQQTQS